MRRLVYIAGGSSERNLCASLMADARAAGWTVTYDWTQDPGYLVSRSPEQLRAEAQLDLDAVRAADVVWVVAPACKSEGSHCELGAALAWGKRVLVSGPHVLALGRIFPLLAEVYPTHEAAFLALLGDRPEARRGVAGDDGELERQEEIAARRCAP